MHPKYLQQRLHDEAAKIASLGSGATEAMRVMYDAAAEAQNWHEAWEALSAHAAKLRAELAALRRGEFICGKCGLRKDAEADGAPPF